ncbi:M48 family metallopeptidase [Marinovum sp. 2_MG-2023]|uniref:M48 family metallopeptidase n=1 Tax=unclassified Marinovum TaxID=2647166 RepID=UPI0026E2A259|nr:MULTISPECIES: M48 family metallopeptidase [unclassified Marinovum]MDO6728380.1 M48 family metallopeptidase [Marinovum sp. 2_MG-2023]MDO6778204.1 M48 family metallopeptidase [Marinovum sp. 1_MG-2023]
MTVIRVGAAPEPFEATGLYFDGDTAVGDLAQLSVDEAARALVIARIGFAPLHWPLDDLRLLPDLGGKDLSILRLRDDPVARLILNDDLLLERLPDVRRAAPVTRRGRLVAWAVAAVASVALIISVLVPTMADQLAVYIPPEGERALGETTLNQIRSALDDTGMGQPVAFCEDPDGVAALVRMQAHLAPGLPEGQQVSVHVLDHPMVNAFALPGGYIVFFRGMIKAAETPEEVAAVFAHEIGHVISRDPTRHALRSAGSIGVLGLLFGDFAGGAMVLFLTEQLIQATYSREAEAGADDFARALLLETGIDPAALGRFFDLLRAKYGERDGFFAHFASHPALSDRILAANVDLPAGFEAVPVLNNDEWQALRNICQ